MASNQIAEAVIKITGNTAEYEKSVKDSKTETEGLGKSASNTAAIVKTALVAGLAAAAVGAVKLATNAGKVADRLLDLKQITGLTTDNLQKFEFLAANAGVSFDGLVGVVTKFTNLIPSLEMGTSESAVQFQKLGVALRDNQGNLRDTNDLFPELIMSLQNIENTTERNSIAQKVFGRSLTDLAPILGMTNEEMQKVFNEAENVGAVLSGRTLDAANAFRAEMDQNFVTLKSLGVQIGSDLAPLMTKTLLPAFEKGISIVSKISEGFSKTSTATKVLGLELVAIGAAFALTGPIGAGVALIAVLVREIADALNSTDELNEATGRLLTTSETYNSVLDELAEAQGKLTESEVASLEIKRDIIATELEAKMITLATAYDNTTRTVERLEETEERVLARQTRQVDAYRRISERRGAGSVQAFEASLKLIDTEERLANIREKSDEAIEQQSETVLELAEAYNENALELDNLRIANRELYLDVINTAAELGGYTAELDSLQFSLSQGYITQFQFNAEVEALKNRAEEASIGVDELTGSTEELTEAQKEWLAEQERIRLEQEAAAEAAANLAEEYRQKIEDTIADEAELLELQRERALELADGNLEAMDAVNDYYDLLAERRAEEEDADYWGEQTTQALDYLNTLGSAVSSVWASINTIRDNSEQAELDRMQAELDGFEGTTEERIALEQKLDDERRRIAYEQAKRNKEQKLFDAIIGTSLAVINFLASGDYVGAILAGVLGAVEIAAIASEPLPQFANGGLVPQRPGTSATGDQQLIRANPGEEVLTANDPRHINNLGGNGGNLYITMRLDGRVIAENTVYDYINKSSVVIDGSRGVV